MTLFFFGYMIQNAISLLNKEPEGDVEVDDSKIATRKTQALMALFAMILVLLFVVYYRLKTGCEPYHDPITIAVGVFVAAAAFGAGIGWYHMLGIVGQDRLSDLFGIANRLLAPGAMKNGPVACVPVP
jgi:dipeptide/tripeptide permease